MNLKESILTNAGVLTEEYATEEVRKVIYFIVNNGTKIGSFKYEVGLDNLTDENFEGSGMDKEDFKRNLQSAIDTGYVSKGNGKVFLSDKGSALYKHEED